MANAIRPQGDEPSFTRKPCVFDWKTRQAEEVLGGDRINWAARMNRACAGLSHKPVGPKDRAPR